MTQFFSSPWARWSAVAACAVLIAACGKGQQAMTPAATTDKPATPPVATVDGTPISRADYDFYTKRLLQGRPNTDLTAEQKNQILDEMISMQLISKQAVKDGLEKDADVATSLEVLRLRILADNRVTVFCAPPTELKRLLRENIDRYDLSALRRAVTGGEAMDRALGARWETATKTKLYEAYGLTESLIVVMNLEGMPLRYGSMGRSGPGSNVEIIDENGDVLPAGEEGDIALEMPHPQMMLSYWEDAERTAACFRERFGRRWFVTGDRAVKDVDGYFWYRCRADDVISSAGYRIGPLEVEIALQEHSSVQQCAVIGSPDPERGEVVKAFVVLAEGFSPSSDLTKELQDHVKSMTAPYKYPRVIVYLESLPMTDSVKINRRALRALP